MNAEERRCRDCQWGETPSSVATTPCEATVITKSWFNRTSCDIDMSRSTILMGRRHPQKESKFFDEHRSEISFQVDESCNEKVIRSRENIEIV